MTESSVVRHSRTIAAVAGLTAMVGGAISFCGWALDVPRLTDWFQEGISIQPNAAVLMTLSGVGLVSSLLGARRVASVLGAIIASVGSLTLLQYIVGADFGFNHQLTFGRTWGHGSTVTPGRVGPPASTSFTLLGWALVLLSASSAARFRRIVPALGMTVIVIAMFSFIGYLYGAENLYSLPWLTAIALQTTLMLMTLAVALVISVPEHEPMNLLLTNSGAGALARRILPILVVLPPLAIWLRAYGHKIGLYDDGMGRAILALSLVSITVGLMWWALRLLARQEQSEREATNVVAGILGSITDAFLAIDRQWRYTFVSDEFLRRTGLQRDQVLGRTVWELFPEGVGNDSLQQAMNERVGAEYEMYHPSWKRWFRNQAYPMADGGLAIYSQDITERKTAAALIAENQKILFELIERCPFGIYIVDSNFRIATMNRGSQDGAFVNVRPVVGRPLDEAIRILWPEPVAAEIIAAFRHTLATGEPFYSKDFVRMRADIDQVEAYEWELHRITLLDSTFGVICYYYDSTTLRDVERALRQSEESVRRQKEQFATLVEHMPDIVARLDRQLRFLYISPAVRAATGRPQEDYIGRARRDEGIPPEFAHRRTELSRRVFETGQEQCLEFPIDTPSGRKVLEMRMFPEFAPDGSVESLMTLTRDITQRKRAEERLQLLWEAATLLLTAADFDSMLRGLFDKIGPHLKLDAYIAFIVNEAGDAMQLSSCYGLTEDAAKSIERLEFGQAICGAVSLQRRPVVATHIQRSDEPAIQLVKSFGIRAYVSSPLQSDNTFLGTLSFASRSRDSFDSDELSFLETICRSATVAYQRLRLLDRLREADRRKDEFLATLAHELRNPLAPVLTGVQLLRLAGPDAAARSHALDMMERQINVIIRLVDDLLEVSRITRGKIELRKQVVDLESIVRSAVESVGPLIKSCGHRLTIDLPPTPVLLDADPVRLAQVLANLLHNAAKYTEAGGQITLSASYASDTAEPREAVMAERPEIPPRDNDLKPRVVSVDQVEERKESREDVPAQVVISIRDTGAGIPAEMLPRVFDLFTQIDRTLGRAQGGLGIGLALVRSLVQMHGGMVEARSDGPGHGSEFIVRLPRAATNVHAAGTQALPTDTLASALSSRRILVVDDNRDVAESIRMLLELLGADVHTVHDGHTALEAIRMQRPSIVFLDIGMPGMDGYTVARQIRSEPQYQDVTLVALTGWGQNEDRERSRAAGFDHHLVKPVSAAALDSLLASLDGKSRRGTG